MPPIPPPTDSGVARSTDAPLHWVRYGPAAAEPLLVLHGGPGADHRYLLPQMLALATPDRALVLYDQRGGGESRSDDRAPITWRTHVADVDAIADALSLDRPVVVGYSWGALLALLHATEGAAGRARLRPRAMVLIDPAPITRAWRDAFEAEFARRQASSAVRDLREALAASDLRTTDPDAYRHRAFELSVAGYFADPRRARDLTPFRVVGRVQQEVWASLGDFDLTRPGALDGVATPTLVIHGREDPIPLASSETLARVLGARLVIIDDCGHVPYVEQPDHLFPAIEAFLASLPPR